MRLQSNTPFLILAAQQVLHVQQPSEGARRDPAAGEHRALGRGRLQVRGRQQGWGQAGLKADRARRLV